MTRNAHHTGHRFRVARARMFAMYGDLCHLCGHGGARQADYLVPVSKDPSQPVDPEGMRPAHGAGRRSDGTDNPCPTCGQRCNQIKGDRPGRVPMWTSRRW